MKDINNCKPYNCYRCRIFVSDLEINEELVQLMDDVENYTILEDTTEITDGFRRYVMLEADNDHYGDLMTIVGSLLTYCDIMNSGITDFHKKKHVIVTLE